MGFAGAAVALAFAAPAAAGPHDYFETLRSRPDKLASYEMRSDLESIPSGGSEKLRQPVTFDRAMDAARFSMYAPVTTDSRTKTLKAQISTGSVLFTWDFRFDDNFRWEQRGNIHIHKTWRIDPGPYLAFKTEYPDASRRGKVAEFRMSLPGARFLPECTPEKTRCTTRLGEFLGPQEAVFDISPNAWVRVWALIEGLGEPAVKVSVWGAEEGGEPRLYYDRLELLPPNLIEYLLMEYDTSAEDMPGHPREMLSWNRNFVALRGVRYADMPALLVPPSPLAAPYTPPSVSLAVDQSSAAAPGAFTLTASASDADGVHRVEFFEGPRLIHVDSSPADGYSFRWTGVAANATHYLMSARAWDGNGWSSRSAPVYLDVKYDGVDTTSPTVVITSHLEGQVVSGQEYIHAVSTDAESGLAGVQILVNGEPRGREQTIPPFSPATTQWETTNYENGEYLLSAVARDMAGNVSTSPAVRVVVDNPPLVPPVITITASDPDAGEGGPDTATFVVSQTADGRGEYNRLSVKLSVGGSAAEGGDYYSIPRVITIPNRASSTTVTLTPLDDFHAEPGETVTLTIEPGVGYEVGAPASATATISDDDKGDGSPPRRPTGLALRP